MEAALIVLVVIFGSVLVLSLVVMFQLVKQMKLIVQALDKRVDKLADRVEGQELAMAELVAELRAAQGRDPLVELVDAVAAWPTKGWATTLATVGARLFRSYFGQRRSKAKALPAPTKKKGTSGTKP